MDPELEIILSCPLCLDIPEKEVFQCSDGHIVCATCIPQLKECAFCKKTYGQEKIRCRLAEAILDLRIYDCRNKFLGCSQILKREELGAHFDICPFRDRKGSKEKSSLEPSWALPASNIPTRKIPKERHNSNAQIRRNSSIYPVADFSSLTCRKCLKFPIQGPYYRSLTSTGSIECEPCFEEKSATKDIYARIGNLDQHAIFLRGRDHNKNFNKIAIIDPNLCSFILSGQNGKSSDTYSDSFDETCTSCTLTPIPDSYYRCLQCKRRILCKSCLDKGAHSHHVCAVVFTTAQDWLVRNRDVVWPVIK